MARNVPGSPTVGDVRSLMWLPLAVALSVGACSSSAAKPKPALAGLQTFKEEPDTRHTTKRVSYDHTPPAGGRHWPAMAGGVYGWLRCGVYSSPVPNEFAVHSEEHGAVWLSYQPALDPGGLLRLATGNPYVLVSPYPGQPGRYMASTWGAQLSAPSSDDPRLAAFVKAYAGGDQGSEKGADCIHGTLPADADKALRKADP
ncbi:MAG: hypothetical protein NVSMB55_07790 [Mycobacteriales bacterium]